MSYCVSVFVTANVCPRYIPPYSADMIVNYYNIHCVSHAADTLRRLSIAQCE